MLTGAWVGPPGDDPFCNPISEVNPFSSPLDVRL